MRKFNLYFAFLAIAVVFAILVACGAGEIIDISDPTSPEYKSINDAKVNLTDDGGLIEHCSGRSQDKEECDEFNSWDNYSSWEEESSSSSEEWHGGEESSSSSESYTPTPSSAAPTPSSSSAPSTTPSSSSTPPPAPSSASCTGGNCYQIPAFTCSWTPGTVVSGDNAQVKINYTGSAPPEGECSQKAWAVVKNAMGAVIQTSSAPVALGTDVQTSGTLQGNPSGTFTWPTSGSVTDIKGTVTCSGGGKEANSKDETCTLSITAPPKPTKSGSISFSNLDYSTGGKYFYIGTTPEVTNNVTVSNNGASPDPRCGEVTTSAIPSTNAAGDIKVYALATCRGSEYKLDSAVAAVVPDPVLGACSWNKDILAKGETATPTATLSNSYGRCGAGNGVVTFSGGFPRDLTESDVGTISNVVATASCSSGDVTQNCPALEVKSAIYVISKQDTMITIPNESIVIEMNLPSGWKPSGTATFACQVDRNGGSGSVSGTIGSGASAVTITGSDYKDVQIPLAWTTGKYSLQVNITCSNSCKCKVGW
ncbi:MAG: hypothetical protein LBQ76_09970 [Candidatus Fibromonas sp.]|jgi:hypothetical protein|nr:hypothetical protein [Candidatus Fibromonas sp.]